MVQDQAEKLRLLVRRRTVASLTGGPVVLVWSTRPKFERGQLLDGLRQAVQLSGRSVEILPGDRITGKRSAGLALRSTGEAGESKVNERRWRCGYPAGAPAGECGNNYRLVDITDDSTPGLRRLEGVALVLVYAGSSAEEVARAYAFVKRCVRPHNLKAGILVHESNPDSAVAGASRRIRRTCARFLGVRLAALGTVRDGEGPTSGDADDALVGSASLKRAAAWIVAASRRIAGVTNGTDY